MEEYNNGLTSDTITNWINEDKGLQRIIQEIESEISSFDEQAELAFHRVSKYFDVPKLESVEQLDYDYDEFMNTCVYQELGLLKYLEPNEDIRGQVLTAIYFLKYDYRTDVSFVFEKYYANHKEEIKGIGFKGENSRVEIVFVKEGENFLDLGCNYFVKYS